MSLFEDTNPRALKELLAEIHGRQMALPDFQRDFLWEPGATKELIVSIANDYPAGSILRVRDSQRVFKARAFQGAPLLDGTKHSFLVLDGQQRLTSLYQAFYGVGEHRYYLDLGKLIDGEDFEESLYHIKARTRWVIDMEDFDLQAKELILPLSVLKGGSGGFLGWIIQATNPMPSEARIRLLNALTHINEQWIKTIDDYHFPVVTLTGSTEPEALCTIFETLNRTGLKLSVFELLTARFWSKDIRLRDLWDKARSDHPVIIDFEIDPYYLLQAIALTSRTSPACKRSDILALTAADVDFWWSKVVAGLVEGIRVLQEDCQVLLPKWLPYQPMLVPLAAALAKAGVHKTAEAGAQRAKINRWFWCTVFGQTYESSANSQSARDTLELSEWFAGGEEPDTVRSFRFDPSTLRDVTPRQRSTYRGTICLMLGANSGARDFHTNAVITGKLMAEEGIDDHHIFPAKYLERIGIDNPRIRDCVLNRTLIDRTTNQMIGDRPPSAYLANIRNTAGFPVDAMLKSHSLPLGAASPLLTNDFEAFLSWRQDTLWHEIQRVTGAGLAWEQAAERDAV